jgi:hypothetical protein
MAHSHFIPPIIPDVFRAAHPHVRLRVVGIGLDRMRRDTICRSVPSNHPHVERNVAAAAELGLYRS